ncbi:MAG: hypothetical protein IJU13_04180 [Bacteroidales bacterium]|nr:hypothetical protein [Bacteroidales bacterium]
MIEVVTNKGISLDLDREQDIQIEMEQPLLDSEHLPVAYSTQINFPLSDTNKSVFGYVPAMMLEPTVKELKASILFSGVEIFSGSLVYDGMEDGMLRYIFTENSLIEELEKDIAPQDAKILPLNGMGPDYAMPIVSDIKYARSYSCEPGPPDSTYFNQGNYVVKDLKFRNILLEDNDSCSFLPSTRILSLLPFLDTDLAEQVCPEIKLLYLVLPYGEAEMVTVNGTRCGKITKDLFPDVAVKDILQSLTSAFSCAIYKEGNKFVLRPSQEMFKRVDDNVLFWDAKISDIYSLSRERAKGYTFSLGEDGVEGDDNTFDQTVSDFNDLHGDFSYKKVKCFIPGSDGKLYTIYDLHKDATLVGYNGRSVFLHDSEIVYRNWGIGENGITSDEEVEVKSQFKPVHTLPDYYVKYDYPHTLRYYNRVGGRVPAIEMPDKDDGRGTDLIVGILSVNLVEYTQIYPQMYLIPQMLYQKYHQTFAEWMGTDRACVKADLRLTLEDLAVLSLYKRVNFRGRDWMIKKLSLTFRVDSEAFEATGEFIGLP